MKINKILLTLVILILFLIFPTTTYAAGNRTVTYIGNYEVTVEESEVKKETVRVAGTMGKVVKSRVTGKPWEYVYYTTDIQGSTRQELSEFVIANGVKQSIPTPTPTTLMERQSQRHPAQLSPVSSTHKPKK